ncbi:MAG: hypothetical protein WD708_05900 [Kiritimatiellia bacterium]
MEYKKVKNPIKPGRPPRGCVWVKDNEGKLIVSPKGELAYRPETAADRKEREAKKASKPRKKRGRKKTSATAAAGTGSSNLLLKKTYKELSSKELERVKEIVESMVDKARENEKKAIERSIDKLQGRLKKLK